jgi:hypothetical protein
VQIARKPSEKIKALDQASHQPFLAAQTGIISLRELLRVMMVKSPCFKMSPMGGGYQGCFAHQHNSILTQQWMWCKTIHRENLIVPNQLHLIRLPFGFENSQHYGQSRLYFSSHFSLISKPN